MTATTGPVTASQAFFWRALLKVKHVPEQIIDVTAMPVVSTLLFTYLFGGALAGSVDAYVQFVLPGIVVQTVLMMTMYTGVALNTDIAQGVFDRFRTLPIWGPAPLVGALTADLVRYAVGGLMTLALGLVLGFRPAGGIGGVTAAFALMGVFCFCLAWVWTLVGLLLPSPQSVTSISLSLTFLLTFVSNIFVDPATMPSWLRPVVENSPVSLLVDAVRGLMGGTATTGSVLTVLAISAGIAAVFAPLTMRRYRAER